MTRQKVVSISLGILAVIALMAVFSIARSVIVPIVIAVLLSFILEPIVRLLQKIHIPRIIGVIFVILVIFGFFYLVGLFLFKSAQSFVREYPNYLGKFQLIFQDINTKYLTRLNIPNDFLQNINWGDTLKQYIGAWSGSFMRFLGLMFVVVIILFFLFLENPHFKLKLKAAFPLHTSRRVGIILEHITRQVSRYLSVKFFISALTGVLVFIVLSIIGVDFPLIWAALAFFLNFIPNLGSIIVSIVIILVSLVQFYPSYGPVAAVAVCVIAIQMIVGNFLDPLLQGDRLNLSPVVILFSLVLWGWLWGVTGAILSVPIAATLKIVCENIPSLRPAGILMGTGYRTNRKRRMFTKKQ